MTDNLNEQQRAAILNELMKGNKIEAIKLYREATGAGLKDAKDFIEALVAKVNQERPGTIPKPTGCGTVALLIALFVLALAVALHGW